MSENQNLHGDDSCRQKNIEKVENVVVEPKNFNNYHNSVVVNLTVNVTGGISDAEIARIIKTVTASLSIELKEIMRTNMGGEGHLGKTTFRRDNLTLLQVLALCTRMSRLEYQVA